MVDAPVIKCAVCGGPAQAGDRSCRYCGAGIATLRCAHCFHANTVDALHCAGCGGELGPPLEGVNGKAECTDCHVELMAYDNPAGTLFSCERCGGQFVQHALLRSMLDHPVMIGHAVTALTLPAQNPLSERVRYRKCPICTGVMNRKNFGHTSGVIIDVCTRHGSWFDPGELPRVLEFARQGGLEHERLREQERQRAKQAQAHVVLRASEHAHETDVTLPELSDVLGFFRDLFR